MNLRTNSDYFPTQHSSGRPIFAMETPCVHQEKEICFFIPFNFKGPVMSWAVSRRHLKAEAWVRSQFNPCEICGGQSDTATGFSPSTSDFSCQYHSTNAPYPCIHLPPTLYNISLPVLQFSPVSTIPPMLHTHSFTYHPRFIMFLSQYFSFPQSVPFHQCSIHIHSPTTHAI